MSAQAMAVESSPLSTSPCEQKHAPHSHNWTYASLIWEKCDGCPYYRRTCNACQVLFSAKGRSVPNRPGVHPVCAILFVEVSIISPFEEALGVNIPILMWPW